MGGRQVTNILLAVIAAVLLFGSAATLGALKWVFAILLALGAIWAIFIAFLWIVERVAEAFREAKQKGYPEVAFVAGALVALCSILVRAIAAGVRGETVSKARWPRRLKRGRETSRSQQRP